MLQQKKSETRRNFFSLPARISFWMIVVAIVPLLITVGVSEWYSRPTLTDQARTAMETDAKTHTQLINNYFNDRQVEVESLAQVPLVQDLLTDPVNHQGNIPLIIQNGQVVGSQLDHHYTFWAVFDLKANLLLSYATNTTNANAAQPIQPHGQYIIPPEDALRLRFGRPFISPVYYDPATQKASVDIYAISYSFALNKALGFVRATLNLDYIWSIVDSEKGANGNGSYAFIVDEIGMRIADPDPGRRFTAIAPVSPDIQQAVSAENRYGKDSTIHVMADSALQSTLKENQPPTTFQYQPTGQDEQFQVTRQQLSVVPWTYLVLSPVNTVINVANQQLLITLFAALLVLIPVTLLGLTVGRRISYPILRSVEGLRNSSQALAELATKQKGSSAEQVWIVDASQTGLQSVHYYNQAANVAIEHVAQLTSNLLENWQTLDKYQVKDALMEIATAAQYIKRAVYLQNASDEKLSTAINVTTQMSEQLAAGAASAAESSKKLQQVVDDLRHIVGQ